MTSRKFLSALLILLASWTGSALADPVATAPVRSDQSAAPASAAEHLAWQRVGDPIREA
ncbi:MAG: hypothetical protein AB1899_03545 [Pseudomonadota bacterium]